MAKKKNKPILNPFYFSVGILFMLSVTAFILFVHYIATHTLLPKIPFSTHTPRSIILAKQYSEPDGLYTLSLPESWLSSYYPWSEGPVNKSWTYFTSQIEPDAYFTISAEIVTSREKSLYSKDFSALADIRIKNRLKIISDFRPVIDARRVAYIGNATGIQYEISINAIGSSEEIQRHSWTYLSTTGNHLLIIEHKKMDEISQKKINTILTSLRIHETGEQ